MNYYTLIASLPHLPPHFDVPRPPITRPRLEQHLELLHEKDAVVLRQLRDFLAWDRQPMDKSDEQVVAEYDRLQREIHHPLVLEIVEERIDVRTLVGALRRLRDGAEPPVGVGKLVDPIRRNWKQPFFGLAHRFPWMERFSQYMLAGEAVQAERVLYECTWTVWYRMASEFTFSFEAVLLYLARWAIIDRWTTRDADAGRKRFDQLIEDTLGEYANLQF